MSRLKLFITAVIHRSIQFSKSLPIDHVVSNIILIKLTVVYLFVNVTTPVYAIRHNKYADEY
jgi:hypothetical protein